jgi:hypothetical protein
MAEGPSHDPIVTNPSADEDTGNDSGTESVTATTSSPTRGVALMAKGKIPELSDFFKKHPSLTTSAKPTMSVAGLLVT